MNFILNFKTKTKHRIKYSKRNLKRSKNKTKCAAKEDQSNAAHQELSSHHFSMVQELDLADTHMAMVAATTVPVDMVTVTDIGKRIVFYHFRNPIK